MLYLGRHVWQTFIVTGLGRHVWQTFIVTCLLAKQMNSSEQYNMRRHSHTDFTFVCIWDNNREDMIKLHHGESNFKSAMTTKWLP